MVESLFAQNVKLRGTFGHFDDESQLSLNYGRGWTKLHDLVLCISKLSMILSGKHFKVFTVGNASSALRGSDDGASLSELTFLASTTTRSTIMVHSEIFISLLELRDSSRL